MRQLTVKTIVQTDAFGDWIDGLRDRRAATIILQRVARLAYGLGDIEPIGKVLSELRIHEGPGYRVYFVNNDPTLIVLLAGSDKSDQRRTIKFVKQLAKEL